MQRLILFVAILFVSCSASSPIQAADSVEVDWQRLRSIDGKPIGKGTWRVVCFLGAECPLARLYGPRLQKLADQFSERGVTFVGINSNPQDSIADIIKYRERYGVQFPIVKDRRQSLAASFKAKRTPQVFVIDDRKQILYQGRIDDQYEPGISRPKPTRHELSEALTAATTGKPIKVAQTKAVGCLITFLKQLPELPSTTSKVTFSGQIAPLLNQHCVECHRKGEIGPFELTEYEEVVGWAQMMLEVIDERRMPPWHADPKFGKFVGERHFPKEARDLIAVWIDQGMPQGDPKAKPALPKWHDGWHQGKPDEVIVMRDKPFIVPAEGTVDYQYFVVDPGWTEDKWLRSTQVIPGEATVVHHAVVFVRPPDGSAFEGIGWIGGYVPGQRTMPMPTGHARPVPAGSKLVFQMHYTPSGRETPDLTKIGFWFADAKSVTHTVSTEIAINHEFQIDARSDDTMVPLKLDRFPVDAHVLGISPHMHLRGKSFRLDVHRQAGVETLLSVPMYDFNWQHRYQLQEPLALKDVDALKMEVRFDNSSGNPANPDPDAVVFWGDQTWQEMAVAFFELAHPRNKPKIIRRTTPKKVNEKAVAAKEAKAKEFARSFIAKLDKNDDGVVERDETSDAFQRYAFYRFDRNRDGKLDLNEIINQARRRNLR